MAQRTVKFPMLIPAQHPAEHPANRIGMLARIEPDMLISAGAGSLQGAIWSHSPTQACVTDLAQHAIVLHLSGSTLVEKWCDGRLLGHRTRIGSVSLVPAQIETQWVLSGYSRVAHMYVHPQRLLAIGCCEGLPFAPQIRDFFAETDEVMSSLVRLVFAQANAGTLDDLAHDELMSMVARHLLRHYAVEQPLPATSPRVTLTAVTLRKVFAHIEDRLGSTLRLAELAALARLSDDHFLRSFKAAVGQTPHRYVLSRRITRSRELLERGDSPIAGIALATGFKGASHFSAVFKAQVGVSPTDWRLQRRK
jgi:AraC family transcriptional regulator